MKTKWMIIPVVALILGCSREVDTNVTYIDGEFRLYATSGESDTRTVLQQDRRVFWSPSDCITVFYGNVPGMFTSTNTEPAASAEFTGSLGSFAIDGETEFRAIYPHSNDIVTPTDEGILSIGLPWEQTGVEGTFADDLFICVAKSKDVNLHFYNVCGGVKFSLARGDIKKVVFRGNNRETLAGRMAVEFDSNGIPQVTDMTGGKSSVTLVAPDGGTFKEGAYYYLVLVPQSLTKGYTMELWTDELVETISSDSPVTIRRSAWGVLKDLASHVPVESVTLDKSELTLSIGRETTLVATVLPENATNMNITWTSSNESIATVSSSGVVKGISIGTARITVSTEDGEKTATCEVTVQEFSPSLPVPEAVDLGLSVLWSSFNLGSNHEYNYGNDYAWGETMPKEEYNWSSYLWSSGTDSTLSKYCFSPSYGYTDYKYVLDPEDDAAYANLGEGWRMPTYEELYELMRNCSWGWINIGQKMFARVVGPSGKAILIRMKGMRQNGSIWSSTLSYESPDQAICVSFSDNNMSLAYGDRCDGMIVRPVYCGLAVILEKEDIVVNIGETHSLSATVVPDSATNKNVSWTSSDESIAIVSSTGIVKGISKGKATITVTPVEGGISATCSVTVKEPVWVPEAVDLGLPSGIKWASFNLGASKPEEYGNKYAWGEVVPKDEYYTWQNYKWGDGSQDELTKYNPYYNCGYNGYWDSLTTLEPEDDAAFVNLGGKWRMPTKTDFEELLSNCSSYKDTKNNVSGLVFEASNGNSIFLPASSGSFTSYWTSSLYESSPYYAHTMYIVLYDYHWAVNSAWRFADIVVRPVYDDK